MPGDKHTIVDEREFDSSATQAGSVAAFGVEGCVDVDGDVDGAAGGMVGEPWMRFF
jgi:hypothetical protein